MPFGPPFDRYYANILAPAAIDANLEPFRADSLFTSTSIIADVWRLTRDATVLLADLTGKNPNVFYELGLAHAIGKPVVLIASSIDDVPFDLRSLRVIIYDKEDESWGASLKRRIVSALRETLKDVTGAVPLPFIEREQVEPPTEDATTYEIRRIWEELRAIRGETSSQTAAIERDDELPREYVAWVRALVASGKLAWATDAMLLEIIKQLLDEKRINAIKITRQYANIGLKEAKDLVLDYIMPAVTAARAKIAT